MIQTKCTRSPEHGTTALMCACEIASVDAIYTILRNPYVDIEMRHPKKGPKGYTAIMHAC